ncbi:uncharacterized protein LOC128955348 isoform X2 [Oppia nitens]|nr:uncharacterized protein LOC128955348 isoform X2 [Oppia nitens]
MGQLLSTASDDRHRKVVEYDIFDNSFVLIERYNKNNTNGVAERFRREYQLAANRDKGYLNWHKVLTSHLHSNGMGYVDAIRKTGHLLKQAKKSSNGKDKKSFNEIHNSVKRLIELRNRELDPKLSILGWVIWGGDQYNSHKYVIDAWKQFGQ